MARSFIESRRNYTDSNHCCFVCCCHYTLGCFRDDGGRSDCICFSNAIPNCLTKICSPGTAAYSIASGRIATAVLPQPSPPPPPNKNPTIQPTITPRPTGIPPASPSDYPSGQPFFSPTAEPTFSQEISVNIVFNQRFQIGKNELEFNEREQDLFCQVIYR